MTPTINNRRLLIVEDDAPKQKAIEQFVSEIAPEIKMTSVRSLSNAIVAIEENTFDIAIIDMSLPTYDFSADKEGGGQPEGFGGSEIIRFIESESPQTSCVIITQYQEFSDKFAQTTKNIEEVTKDLDNEFGDILLGVIYYSGQRGSWRDELKTILKDLLGTRDDS